MKESAGTGLFGLAFLVSLLTRRPLLFYFGRQFATGGDPERIAYWEGLWRYESFRRAQRLMTAVWGVVLLAEAGARVVLSYAASPATVVAVSPVIAVVVIAALMLWTMAYGRMVRRQSLRDRASAPAAAPGPSLS